MDYQERLKNIMAAVFGVTPEDIDEETSQDTIEDWDSICHMNLITAIEEEFDIRFDNEEIADLLNWKIIALSVGEKI